MVSDLADRLLAEAMVRGLLDQLESRPFVGPACAGQHAIGPQHDPAVPRLAGKPQAFVHQTVPYPQATGPGST